MSSRWDHVLHGLRGLLSIGRPSRPATRAPFVPEWNRRNGEGSEWDRFQVWLDAQVAAAPTDRPPVDASWDDLMPHWNRSPELSAEEWAAREAADLMNFGSANYLHSDPKLDAWVQRVDAILTNGYALELCRRHFMTDEELAHAHAREWEEW